MKRDPPAAQHPSSVSVRSSVWSPCCSSSSSQGNNENRSPEKHCLCSPPAVSGRPLWLGRGQGRGGALGPLKGKGTIRGRLREEVPPNDPEHFENSLRGLSWKSQTSGWEGGDGVSVCVGCSGKTLLRRNQSFTFQFIVSSEQDTKWRWRSWEHGELE